MSLVRSVQESEFVRGLQEAARRERLCINVGVHEPGLGSGSGPGAETGPQKVKNTLLWIDEAGEIVQRYQKIHLFDVEIKDGPVLRESNSVEKGMKILPPFGTPVGRVGMTICFDVRPLSCPSPSSTLTSLPIL